MSPSGHLGKDESNDGFEINDDAGVHLSDEELAEIAAEVAENYDPIEGMTEEELAELAAEAEVSQEEYERALVQDALRNISTEAAKGYLAKYGDAVDARVTACLTEADTLLAHGHYGPALALAATAIELMVRFLLLRPLVQGAFLSDRWAGILATRIATGRTAQDREMLPAILREWGVDVVNVRAPSGVLVWAFLIGNLWPSRDHFVHRFAGVEEKVAIRAVECAKVFRSSIVSAVAKRLGFTLDKTGRWSVIESGKSREETPTDDPFTEGPKKPKA